MATITRGATTLTPTLVSGWSLTRPGRSVVHDIIGADPDVTTRAPGPLTGDVRAIFASEAAADAALEALSVPGGPWVITAAPIGTFTAAVVGDVRLEAVTEWGGTWAVTFGVLEVTA